jgi:hypothetical protein
VTEHAGPGEITSLLRAARGPELAWEGRSHCMAIAPAELVALDEALVRLAAVDPRLARVVDARLRRTDVRGDRRRVRHLGTHRAA